MFKQTLHLKCALLLSCAAALLGGCAVEAAKKADADGGSSPAVKSAEASESGAPGSKGARIKIEPGSPADTVRVFYKNLREKRFREALFLTNLRPAIEGLTDAELGDLQVDFASLASDVPEEIEINGEIVSGDKASVTAKLPDNDTGKQALQELKLRKEGDVWIILTVDEEAEKLVKKEGKNYFFALRLETAHAEVKKIMKRISEAEMVFALQNKGEYGEMAALIQKGLLAPEIASPEATGYAYQIKLTDGKKHYSAAATPAAYGKTGKLSYLLELDGKNNLHLEEKDNGGQPLKK